MPSNKAKASRNGSATSTPEQQARELMRIVGTYLKDRPEDIKFIQSALEFATECHEGQKRESGEPYITHPIFVATWLAKLKQEPRVVAAGLLHDTVEDCEDVTNEAVAARFGDRVAYLVDGVTKFTKIELALRVTQSGVAQRTRETERDQIGKATFLKLILSGLRNSEVLLVKLVDKLHNVSTLEHVKDKAKRLRTAEEALKVYAPLADRLGVNDIKWRMEDEAFREVNPKAYNATSNLVRSKRRERERYAAKATDELQKVVDGAGMRAEVSGRVKHLYSIHQKKKAYEEQGKTFNEINDLIALRVITENEDDCYKALGIVHRLWTMKDREFDDYISNPKTNGYKSIHTTVLGPRNSPLEVQIRSRDMHRVAEEGIAAHSAYKEDDADPDQVIEFSKLEAQTMNELRKLVANHNTLFGNVDEAMKIIQEDLGKTIRVFTPLGEVRILPEEATALDFAYKIHSEVGHRAAGVLVDGKVVPLNTRLKEGQEVKVNVSNTPKGPSLDWLDESSGYILTSRASDEIKKYFRSQGREKNLADGDSQLDKLMQRLQRRGYDLMPDDVSELLGYSSLDDLKLDLGRLYLQNSTALDEVVTALNQPIDPNRNGMPKEPGLATTESVNRNGMPGPGIVVDGLTVSDVNVPKCCSPQYGDEVIGYQTRRRGVTVHRTTCERVTSSNHPERLTKASWGHRGTSAQLRVRVEGSDRIGFAYDILGIPNSANMNVRDIKSVEHGQGGTELFFTVEVTDTKELHELITKIEVAPDVKSVARVE